jgi:hypothetical protein
MLGRKEQVMKRKNFQSMLFEFEVGDDCLGELPGKVSSGRIFETRKNLFGENDAPNPGAPLQDQDFLSCLG